MPVEGQTVEDDTGKRYWLHAEGSGIQQKQKLVAYMVDIEASNGAGVTYEVGHVETYN